MSQADSIRFRGVRVATTDTAVSAGPTDGVTVPHFQMSPTAPLGMPTQGFIFMLKAPILSPATAGAGGFTVVIWFRDPNSQRWGSAVSVSISFGQMWVCSDVDAMDGVIFQITNVAANGDIDIHFAEQ